MNAEWAIRALAAAAMFAFAAFASEQIAAWYARSQRWVWVAALAASVAIPVLAWYAPAIIPRSEIISRTTNVAVHFAPQLSTEAPRATSIAAAPVVAAPLTTRMRDVVRFAWPAASLALLLFVVLAYARLRAIRSRARAVDIDGTTVRIAERTGPAVVGYLHPAIVLPRWVANASAAERRVIVLHEREHIEARDHWLMAFGTLALIAMPWNVALWWQYARLRLAIETDCDARVVARGADREFYGRTLIRSAGFVRTPSLLAPALGDPVWHLRRRILAMTARPPRARLVRAASFAVIAGALVIVACASTAQERHPSDSAPRALRATPVRASAVPARPEDVAPHKKVVVTADATGSHPARLELASVRVTGFTRPALRTRLTITGAGARLVVLNAANLRRVQGDTLVEFVTPAEFRVDGAHEYRLRAEALEEGTEVEIAGTSPTEEGIPRAGSARGPAPMIRFGRYTMDAGAERELRTHDVDSHVAAPARANAVLPSTAVVAPAAMLPSLPDRAIAIAPRNLKPGQILIEAESGGHEQVRVDIVGIGSFSIRGGSMAVDRAAGSTVVTTPATIAVPRDQDFAVRFVAVDTTASFFITAVGGDGYGFAQLGGHYPIGAIVCRAFDTAGIGGPGASSTWSSPPKCSR